MKEVLGEHANQAGSLVAPDIYDSDLYPFWSNHSDELAEMERIVNEKKSGKLSQLKQLKQISIQPKNMGAMALLGEK